MIYISSEDSWSSRYKISNSHVFRRPSRYKVSSEDTVILSIQDPVLMLLGATRCFMVNLMFGVMILSIQHLYLQWRFVILAIQDLELTFLQKTLSIEGLKWWYSDPLDTRSRSHDVKWPAGSRSTWCLEWRSSRYKIYISNEDSWSFRYKISNSHFFRRPSRYKVSSEDTMILSIQDPGLMLIGVARWFKVDLMFGVMILLIQDLYLHWRFVILSIQDLELTCFQ